MRTNALIEHDCQLRAQHACTWEQLLTGPVAADGAHMQRLKFDPRTDPKYTYTLTVSGMAWEAHANAKKPGLMGFCYVSRDLVHENGYYSPSGTASTIDRGITGSSVEGDSFATR